MLFTGCSDSRTEKTVQTKTQESVKIEKKVKAEASPIKETSTKVEYTIQEIYNAMCIECHNTDGTGNTEKLTPSMATLTQEEMIGALKDVEADKGHIINGTQSS